MHGFPESWSSWRHQMAALAEAGYRAVAMDQRGYGQSDKPDAVEAYNIFQLAGDLAGLVNALGEKQAVIVGHDWGCNVAWYTAWLHPEKVVGVGGLSVTWFGRGELPLSEVFQEMFKDRYFYINDFQCPELNDQLDADHRETITKIMLGKADLLSMPQGDATLLERISMPEKHPDWVNHNIDAFLKLLDYRP